ncbi:MAG: hypothetical protein HZB38_16400 [Planctomycetes bacterium]|nr:hypothetical protein [Planctomycetota bacterium]
MPASQPAPASQPSIEDEVLANLRSISVGDHTLGDWNMPEPFLRRVGDRIVHGYFERNFRRVVREEHDTADTQPAFPASQPASAPAGDRISITLIPPADTGERKPLSEQAEMRPALRGFRASAGKLALPLQATSAPDASPAVREARAYVGRRLATDGLLRTLDGVIERLGPDFREQLAAVDRRSPDAGALLAQLAATGLPLDLLAMCADDADPDDALWSVLRRAAADKPPTTTPAFRFRASRAGFRLAEEDGTRSAAALRLQMTRATDWMGPDDGGSLDILRQFCRIGSPASLHALIHAPEAEALRDAARIWRSPRAVELAIESCPATLAQWAQDNHKYGWIEADGHLTTAAIVPRYASRGEDGAVFVPGESLATADLPNRISSPLLFQGGNLLCVADPVAGQRVLLIGEADVHRNVAFGLTPEQVIEAFQTETGVDRCVVLPAVSFHIDFEVCPRVVDGRVVVFMNDQDAAARIVLRCGLAVLKDAGVLDEKSVRRFARSPGDSGVGNLYVFLFAMDWMLASSLQPQDIPSDRTFGTLRAMRRNAQDREAIAKQLADLGWRIVRVPSISNEERGINYLNGLSLLKTQYVPVWGGLYADLDRAALDVYRKTVGPSVEVVPILTSETQRRGGGLHCAVSVVPEAR